MNEVTPVIFDDDNPEWSAADFARARPATEVLPAGIAAKLVRGRGRPKGSTSDTAKKQITLRLDLDVIDKFRAGGPGWQGRINEALRRAG